MQSNLVRASMGAVLLLNTLILAAPDRAIAQSATSPEGGIEEITVTAEKRSESLTRVPVSVSVLNQEQLQQSGVLEIKDLTTTVPSLQLGTVSYSNVVEVSIRGITNADFNELGDQAVATYVDGVYIARTQGLLLGLFDLGQIEVLRGPQGTLYGLNSTGGNVNINTADPKHDFGAAMDVSYGNYNDILFHGTLNIPLSDTLAVRLAGVAHQSTGYYDTGGIIPVHGTSVRNYAASQSNGARATILWTPIDSFKWRLSVDNFRETGTPGLDFATGPDGKPIDGLPVYNRPVNDTAQPSLYINNFMARSNMSYRFNNMFSLTYIAGYQNVTSISQGDNDGTALRIFDSVGHFDQSKSQSHELDFHFDSARFQNILGATFFEHNMFSHGAFDFYPLDLGFSSQDFPHNEAKGIFDQGTFNVTDSFHLIAGLRYTSQQKSTQASAQYLCPPGTDPTIMYNIVVGYPACAFAYRPNGNATFTNTSWKVGAAYDLSDRVSSYFTVTTGFKAGGLNPGSDLNAFKPEKVTNYEVGLKGRFFDDRLSSNLDVYFENYKDLQESQVILSNGGHSNGAITTNAASAHLYGLEEEATWRITSADSVTGFFDYMHNTYAQYDNATDNFTGINYASVAGNSLPYSPKVSARLRYQHDFEIEGKGTISPSVSVYGQTKMYFREFNLPIDTVPSYTKTDININFTDLAKHWTVDGYVTNAENKAVRNHAYTVASYYFSDYAPPRMFGVRVGYKY